MTMQGTSPQALLPRHVAERWGCSEATVRRMLRNKELPGFRAGGKLWRIRLEDVVRYEECQTGSASSTEDAGMPSGQVLEDLSAWRSERQTRRKA
ncbi:hypothetical protein DLJ53_28820 [Acuticoccus sediminis]|uniref:Helix-turn-helix domain-containing protein n=1 Tax=Acuticoccus sediminis TaxID=2184697 RepID=A0A8B2NN71_9HYPH|nr:hypothetical protein DLJ53_28820 [Acuticoccus sediminis]